MHQLRDFHTGHMITSSAQSISSGADWLQPVLDCQTAGGFARVLTHED